MLTVTSVAGNMFVGYKPVAGKVEHLKIPRVDLAKNRIRRQTDAGTDIGIALELGAALHNGDVLECGGKVVIVEQLPEKVIEVSLDGGQAGLAMLVGHIIGNRHRPIAIKDGTVCFPIQADSELETFKDLFAGMAGSVRLKVKETVFTPQEGADVHGH